MSYSVVYNPPGGKPKTMGFGVNVTTNLGTLLAEAASPGGLHPHVYPAQNPMITRTDGSGPFPLFQDQAGVGLTPTISWTAPATGTPPNYYRIFITGLTDGSFSQLFTTSPSFTVPPGVFSGTGTCASPGVCYYVVDVRAVNEPCRDPRIAPQTPRCAINVKMSDIKSEHDCRRVDSNGATLRRKTDREKVVVQSGNAGDMLRS